MPRILVLNGPNLNLLGTREPHVYGSDTLADIIARLERLASARGATLVALQSNAEHELIAAVQGAKAQGTDAIIVRVGTLDDPEIGKPVGTIWTKSAPSWACIDAGLPRGEGQTLP